MNLDIEKLVCKSHITALHYHNNRLFVGCGQEIEIYDCSSDIQLLIKLNVFNCFSIYGIKVFENDEKTLLLINGDRFLSIFEFIITKNELKLINDKINLYDWILEVRFDENNIYALLTSNKLAIFNLITDQLNIIDCPQKSTIYASIFLNDFNRLNNDLNESKIVSIAAGTVFSEILICNYTESNCVIIDKLTGHKGVIFSIDFRQELNLLASASDDRTIRLWTYSNDHFQCSQVLFGHESRIWQVRLANDCIISVGENSSLFFWSYKSTKSLFKEKSKKVSYWRLALDEKNNRIFYGASDNSIKQRFINDVIKSSSVLELDNLKNVKRFHFFEQNSTQNIAYLFVIDLNGKANVIKADQNNGLGQIVCEFDFGLEYSNYNVLVLDQNEYKGVLGNLKGEIVRFKFDKRKIEIIAKKKLADYKLFNLFVVNNEDTSSELISCGPDGMITIHDLKDLKMITKFEIPQTKYRQVNCALKLNENLLALGDRSGNLIIYKYDKDNNETKDENKDNNQNDVSYSNYKMIKLFKKVHSLVGIKQLIKHPFDNKFYSCGRNGQILEYAFDLDNTNGQEIDLLRLIKPQIEIDHIGKIEFDRITGDLAYVIGFKSKMFVVWNNRTQSIEWTVEASNSTRPWTFTISSAKLNFVFLKHDKLIYTFKQLDQSLLIRPKYHSNIVLCAHLLFETYTHNTDHFSCKNIEKIKDVERITNVQSIKEVQKDTGIEKSRKIYFITGCEDGDLFINSFDGETNRTSVETVLYGHISNVRACMVEELGLNSKDELNLKSSNSKKYLAHNLLITVGGASHLLVHEIKLDSNHRLIAKQLVNYAIWGSDKESMNKPWIKKPKQLFDSQIRFMDISLRRLGSTDFLISAICSDATLRLFCLSLSKSYLHLIGTFSFSNYCLLKIIDHQRLSIITSNEGRMYLIKFDLDDLNLQTINLERNFVKNPLDLVVNESDKNLMIQVLNEQKQNESLKLLDTIKTHQFGINSIDFIEIDSNKVLFFTVGEDTSLGYTLVSYKNDELDDGFENSLDKKSMKNENIDHKSIEIQFTGNCLLKHSSMVSIVKVLNRNLLMTASWDRRIKFWQFKINLEQKKLELICLRTIISSISDISEVIVNKYRSNELFLIVLGGGKEIYKMKIDLNEK